MMKLYKRALDDKLSNPEEYTSIQEDSGLYETDFTGSLGNFSWCRRDYNELAKYYQEWRGNEK